VSLDGTDSSSIFTKNIRLNFKEIKMTKKTKLGVMITSLCLIIFSGIIFIKPSLINSKLNNSIQEIRCSYHDMDLDTLKNDSDIIIKGIVEEVSPSYIGKMQCIIDEVGNNHEYQKQTAQEAFEGGADVVFIVGNEDAAEEVAKEYKEKNEGIVYTNKVVRINSYYKNNIGLEKILVRERGGNISGRCVQIVDDNPLGIGDEVILFLKRLNGNKYNILGGAQGKYFIQGDTAINILPKKTIKLDELEAEIIS